MSQFKRNTPSSRLTEWTLDLWTTKIRRCGLWRCPVHGWSIGKRSPQRRRSRLRFELKKRYPGYDVEQCNIIIDVLGGWSREDEEADFIWQQGLSRIEKDAEGRLPSQVLPT